MKYKEYTALDFANDTFFIRWVKHPDAESDFFWHTFIRENPSRRNAIEEAREMVLSFNYQRHFLSDDTLAEMRNGLWMNFLAEKQTEKAAKQRSRWWLAAAALLPLALFAGYLFLYDRTAPQTIADNVHQNKTTRLHGRNSIVLLDDGTRIWLNDSSSLVYNTEFTGQPTRDVYLEGEAFFEVAKDASRPFIVHTSSIKIKVLGTSFSVKSYAHDKTVETTLVSGKVHIEQSDDRGQRISDIELKPNQKAVYNKESKVINVRDLENVTTASWKRDRLIFDEESVEHVLQQLEKWYGVEIHADADKLDCSLTATIEKESLEEILSLLQLSHGINYSIDGRNVFISGSFCN